MTEAASFSDIVDAVREQTAHLLGTTISYDADDWAQPTPLPGWTRSHVAAHLVEGALDLQHRLRSPDGLGRFRSRADRRVALEKRALSPELELQIQLDETAGELQPLLAAAETDERTFRLGDWLLSPAQLATLRLRELTIHHYDLIGELADLPEFAYRALLGLEVTRPALYGMPGVLLLADDGFSERMGSEGSAPTTVIGPARDLLLWLARGVNSPNVSGALDIPNPASLG
ncbi:maleylpyruvate isomerase family mycothiol-dependent enzyme [Tessaracoccus sp. OH4464_COT-324]|uniref:maleylpyruvate isomerase family mycothiol-dependent enzyme n=1 Tax=Tessaracoccus sp. OH4464_COT-324 TaxID=2491059 RepID=UPI000F63E4B5|nr:maleylpyruvate isomerase family mycothiol-dependent enzyme [Tessaracoccus sp. OH4464_COT-324]RRD47696.1 maleylpyruvate isomerase family mycothiol-dependent enzyme [Tessaracoccus sp. OH4464_COT-324]